MSDREDAQSILTKFENDRRIILFGFDKPDLTDIIKSNLSIDTACMSNMGRGNIHSNYKCNTCRSFDLICDLGNKNNKELYIANLDKCLYVKDVANCDYRFEKDSESNSLINLITQIEGLTECNICGNNEPTNSYLATGSWMNDVLLNWITDTILRGKNIPSTDRYLKVFICGNTGYTIREQNILSLDKLSEYHTITPELIQSIVLQITIIFAELEKHNFIYGDSSWSNLGFINQACNYQYENINVESPVTIKLTNMSKASIDYKGVRVFPIETLTRKEWILNLSNSITKLDYGSIDVYNKKFVSQHLFYKINNSDAAFKALYYSGYPLPGCSYDYYLIITSLLCHDYIYEVVKEDGKMKNLWTNMFSSRENVPQLLVTDEVTSKIVVECLNDIFLRCSVITSSIEEIKTWS